MLPLYFNNFLKSQVKSVQNNVEYPKAKEIDYNTQLALKMRSSLGEIIGTFLYNSKYL